MKKIFYLTILAFGILISSPTLSEAHGVDIHYKAETAYKITATYDNGEPIGEAQVTIFSPENPAEPWLKGVTDENGVFLFSPDFSQSGTWNVQVRKAGHGGMIPIEISSANPNETNQATVQASSTGSYSTTQLVIMIVAILWGFIGTALYFKRKA